MIEQMHVAKQVVHLLEQAGYEAVIVGGAVRDALLGRAFHDVDVATEALPQQVKALFPKTIDVGIEHGTVLVLHDGIGIEVTTYRTESTYTDHRRPDGVQFVRDLRQDLQRRDFTMNALAMRANGEIVDYYGGEADLHARIIRAVGEPHMRFEEDALRMLRAVRFVAQLGFSIEPHTKAAMQQHAPTIAHIAIERIQAEFEKLFVGPFVTASMAAIRATQLDRYLAGTFEPEQWQHVHFDNAIVGWAYFAYVSQFDAATIARVYRLANKQKQFIAHVLALVDKHSWTPMDYFAYETDVLYAAQAIRTWQQLHVVTKAEIDVQKAALPIQTKEELAINGQHLMQWCTQKRGPWIKEALAAILEAVVTKQLQNDTERIKDWFNREWNN